jgi:hypothetical protein
MKQLIVALALLLACSAPAKAATRTEFPGAVYADCLTTGEKVASLGSGLITHLGPLTAPDTLLFNRLTNVPSFQIASKAQNSNTTWRFDGRDWIALPVSHGVQGHIWRGGELVIMSPCTDCESQGYRYVAADGSIVEGSPTYNSFTPLARALGVTRLYGWTQLGPDLFVGQGDMGGTAFQYRGKHYLLEPGDTQFIQGHEKLPKLAIALTRFAPVAGVCHELTVDEIASLPAYPSADPVVTPPPPPPPPVEPPPQADPDSLFADVEAEWNKLGGNLSFEQKGELLNRVAWKHRAKGWGLSRKTGGHNCPSPVGQIACDILHHKPTDTLWDALADNGPIWGKAHPHNNPDRPWVAPVAPGNSGPVDPPPPSDDVEKLKARIKELEAQAFQSFKAIVELTNRALTAEGERDAARKQLEEIQAAMDQIQAERDQARRERDELQVKLDNVRCEGQRIFGIKFSCKVIR